MGNWDFDCQSNAQQLFLTPGTKINHPTKSKEWKTISKYTTMNPTTTFIALTWQPTQSYTTPLQGKKWQGQKKLGLPSFERKTTLPCSQYNQGNFFGDIDSRAPRFWRYPRITLCLWLPICRFFCQRSPSSYESVHFKPTGLASDYANSETHASSPPTQSVTLHHEDRSMQK